TNTVIGLLAYVILRRLTNLRKIDAATVAGYYGSDSAGTFVTCVGVLTAAAGVSAAARAVYTPAAYMPVMLAVMEVPGCLVALFLVSMLRHRGMDSHGNAAGEEGYQQPAAEEEVQLARVRSGYHAESEEEQEVVVTA